MPELTLDDLKRRTSDTAGLCQEWQRYTLDGAWFGNRALAPDDIHVLMVAAVQDYRDSLINTDRVPALNQAQTLGSGLHGWATLALKGLPSDASQSQWPQAWRVVLVPNARTNTEGEFFHVAAHDGSLKQSRTTPPQEVTYDILYKAAGGNESIISSLVSIVKRPSTQKLPDTASIRLALRQLTSALFLTEPHRNHLTLLVNVAMLDLIMGGVFSLRYFLGALHPMTQGGPMADLGNGTEGAISGGNPGSRTRILATTILLYWLKLLEPEVVLEKGADLINFNAGQQPLSKIRRLLSSYTRESLCAVPKDSVLRAAIRERFVKTLLRGALEYR